MQWQRDLLSCYTGPTNEINMRRYQHYRITITILILIMLRTFEIVLIGMHGKTPLVLCSKIFQCISHCINVLKIAYIIRPMRNIKIFNIQNILLARRFIK